MNSCCLYILNTVDLVPSPSTEPTVYQRRLVILGIAVNGADTKQLSPDVAVTSGVYLSSCKEVRSISIARHRH